MFSAHEVKSASWSPHRRQRLLALQNVGGLYTETLVGNRVRFESGTIGVIYEKGELKDLTLDKLYIDIGAESKKMRSKVGSASSGSFWEFTDLGSSDWQEHGRPSAVPYWWKL